MVDNAAAVELYNFINNEARLWKSVECQYRAAELAQRNGEFVPEYLEADLRNVCYSGARGYIREYLPTTAKINEYFPFDVRRECAKLLVNNFVTERDCGNGWL